MNNMKVRFPYYTTVGLQPHVVSKCCVLEDIACPYIFVKLNILKCRSVEDRSDFVFPINLCIGGGAVS